MNKEDLRNEFITESGLQNDPTAFFSGAYAAWLESKILNGNRIATITRGVNVTFLAIDGHGGSVAASIAAFAEIEKERLPIVVVSAEDKSGLEEMMFGGCARGGKSNDMEIKKRVIEDLKCRDFEVLPEKKDRFQEESDKYRNKHLRSLKGRRL